MKQMINSVLCLSLALIFTGCTKPDDKKDMIERVRIEAREQAQAEFDMQLKQKDKLIEKARAEGKAQAEDQLRMDNENLQMKSEAMEEDLQIRHRFYQAVRGTYEGSFKTEQGMYKFRITIAPSLAPYPVGRVRQLEEVSADLSGLHFNAQVIQWNPSTPLSSVGCRVEGIRPDIQAGTITIASSSCPNLYLLQITDSENQERNTRVGERISEEIRAVEKSQVSALVGEIRPTTNAEIYKIFAPRKTE